MAARVVPLQRSASRGAMWAACSVAAVVAIAHFATAGQYDIFRNELYFIVCGRHPALGYVDQPPLVPLIAAMTQLGGVNVWLLRLPAVIAAIALVPLVVAFATLLGASVRGAWLSAMMIACATLVTALTATLSTSTFEALTFTAVAYLITRAYLKGEPQSYVWAGVVAGLSFETRYGILMWAFGMAVGIAAAGPREILRSRDLWLGIAIAVLIALPNIVWQAAHGFPFLELVRNDNSGNLIGSPLEFFVTQLFLMNFLTAPLWIAGVIAPFVSKRLAAFRFLSITFAVTAILVLTTHGKAYYMGAAYPAMFALGAAALTKMPRIAIAAWVVLTAIFAAPALPFVLPMQQPDKLKFTLDHMSFKMKPMERAGIGAPLMQVFSDEFGWRDLAREVGKVYTSLTPADRVKAAIFASNYGEAAAIDVYGVALPPALSGNNQYYLWGPRGYDGSVVIAVNVDPNEWAKMCQSSQVVATFGNSPYAMPYETHRPIVLCRGMQPPLGQTWPRFKHYGIENLGTRAVDRQSF